ncbi:MAG: methyltransferase [Myxococcota bacterium]|jgi:tRNA1(Val) A37 N6-methylase TrmN6|nr:methyltransferase [Myxococcota bacterium]
MIAAVLGPDDPLTDDALTGDFRVWQRARGHRYSLDDVLTAHEARRALEEAVRAGRALHDACDLGCGLGSVLLMIAWARPELAMVGVEAQEVSFELARRNVARNGVEARVRLLHGDLRDPHTRRRAIAIASPHVDVGEVVLGGEVDVGEVDAIADVGEVRGEIDASADVRVADAGVLGGGGGAFRGFDLVTGTPPYVPPGQSTPSPDSQKAHARVELRGGIEDYLAAASELVAPDGVVVICGDARFPERAFRGAERVGLHVRRQRDARPRAGRAPLFSVWTFTREPGPFERALDFVARDDEGQRTEAYFALRTAFGLPPTHDPRAATERGATMEPAPHEAHDAFGGRERDEAASGRTGDHASTGRAEDEA